MSYKIELRHAAQKQLNELPERDYKAIAEIISSLAQEPPPRRVKKLADSGLWRIRARKYRVVYAIDDKTKLITIVRIARRREDTYQSL
ncbi:MAG: type II toxin-antitoxin system RelE/ParE family toxin [Dehalococcoidia bacterium]